MGAALTTPEVDAIAGHIHKGDTTYKTGSHTIVITPSSPTTGSIRIMGPFGETITYIRKPNQDGSEIIVLKWGDGTTKSYFFSKIKFPVLKWITLSLERV